MHSPLWTYLGVGPSGIAVATRNHHTSECQGALHKVLSEWLKLTHTLCCLPQVAKVTIASFLCAFILYMHKQCCIHTNICTSLMFKMLPNSQLTLSQAHMLYACIMYTKLYIACMYCINSEHVQLLLVMFVKKLCFYCIIILVCMLYVLWSFVLKSCMQRYRMYTIYIVS